MIARLALVLHDSQVSKWALRVLRGPSMSRLSHGASCTARLAAVATSNHLVEMKRWYPRKGIKAERCSTVRCVSLKVTNIEFNHGYSDCQTQLYLPYPLLGLHLQILMAFSRRLARFSTMHNDAAFVQEYEELGPWTGRDLDHATYMYRLTHTQLYLSDPSHHSIEDWPASRFYDAPAFSFRTRV